jgi:STE24 endopeptidase
MPFLLLLVLAVACLYQGWPRPSGDLPLGVWALLAWLPMAGAVGVACVVTRWASHRLRQTPEARESVLRRYGVFRSYHIFILIAAYGLTLYELGWGWLVYQFCTVGSEATGYLVPGAELLLLAPLVTGLLLSWAFYHDVERTIHETAVPLFVARPYWGRWSYVGFHARQNLALVAAPLTLLIVVQGLVRQFPALRHDEHMPLAALGSFIGVLIILPWILRLILGLRPLPPGPLRDRLIAEARRLNFRFTDILVWNTHGGVANAMVAGILPLPRYIVFSDRLLAGLSDDELEAVFGHEVGHVKHWHIAYYLGFLLISLGVLIETWHLIAVAVLEAVPSLRAHFSDNMEGVELTLLPLACLYIFVVFGFLSRRCERQADIFGCRAVSCDRPDCPDHGGDVRLLPAARGLCSTGIRTFIRALEKVAHLNGISRSRPGWLQSWQHSTIARRVEFLQHMLSDPGIEPRFQRRVGQVKWALLMGLTAVLVILCAASE